MQKLFCIIPVLMFIGCGNPGVKPDLEFKGQAAAFVQVEKNTFLGQSAIENSLVIIANKVLAFYDPKINGELYRSDISDISRQIKVDSDSRFTYVMTHLGILYNFMQRADGIYMKSSIDAGFTWNEAKKVLSKSSDPNSIYYQVWNVGVDVDDQGVWHMLVECSKTGSDPYGVGLGYVTATMTNSGDLDFDLTKTNQQVLQKGAGNPFVKYVQGKGLLLIYGLFENGYWRTTAGTMSGIGFKSNPEFYIGAKFIHVCDPSAIEINGKIILTISYDQVSIYKTEAEGLDFESLFDKLF